MKRNSETLQDQIEHNDFWKLEKLNSIKEPSQLKETSSTSDARNKKTAIMPSFVRNRGLQTYKSQKNLNLEPNIKNFKLIRRLGEGKFGKVYLAK